MSKNDQIIKSPKLTTVINFLGGPGTCKSTFTSGVFAEFKRRGLDCEMSMEYAKLSTAPEKEALCG